MADEVDLTAERMERELAMLIGRRVQHTAPAACGACLWCEAPLDPPLRWCDADCRDDWERAHARQARR